MGEFKYVIENLIKLQNARACGDTKAAFDALDREIELAKRRIIYMVKEGDVAL